MAVRGACFPAIHLSLNNDDNKENKVFIQPSCQCLVPRLSQYPEITSKTWKIKSDGIAFVPYS